MGYTDDVRPLPPAGPFPAAEAARHVEPKSDAPATPPRRSLLDAPDMLDSSFGGAGTGGGSSPPAGAGAAASPARVAASRSPARLSVSSEGSGGSPGRREQRPLNSPLRASAGPGAKGARAHLVAHNPHMDDEAVVGPGTHSLIASAPPPGHGHGHAHAHSHHGKPREEPASAADGDSPPHPAADGEACAGEDGAYDGEYDEEYDEEDGEFEEFDPCVRWCCLDGGPQSQPLPPLPTSTFLVLTGSSS